MNKVERIELYKAIIRWLKYSPYSDDQRRAIQALLGSLSLCERDRKQYERHMEHFKTYIKNNEEKETVAEHDSVKKDN